MVGMFGSQKKQIDDFVIETLAKKPYITGPELVSCIQKKRGTTTKQAVYAALTPLLDDEVVHKRGQEYALTNTWVRYMRELLSPDQFATDEVFALADGQSISYRFPNLLACDKYWAHIFSTLLRSSYQPRGVWVWHPHYIFAIWRVGIEQEIAEDHKLYENPGYYSFGGDTELDRETKRTRTTEFVRINVGQDFGFKNNYFLNIFGDILVEVFLASELAQKIDNWFAHHKKPTADDIAGLVASFQEPSPVRMKISRNAKKAQRLRKKMARDFYVRGGV